LSDGDAVHLLIRGKAAGCLLGPGKAAIHGDLENAAAGFAQVDPGGGMGFQDLVPRRDRTRLIASHSAVFDVHVHFLRPFGGWARKKLGIICRVRARSGRCPGEES
jgi:hypothetical protein